MADVAPMSFDGPLPSPLWAQDPSRDPTLASAGISPLLSSGSLVCLHFYNRDTFWKSPDQFFFFFFLNLLQCRSVLSFLTIWVQLYILVTVPWEQWAVLGASWLDVLLR